MRSHRFALALAAALAMSPVHQPATVLLQSWGRAEKALWQGPLAVGCPMHPVCFGTIT